MTISELYEWARENGVENTQIMDSTKCKECKFKCMLYGTPICNKYTCCEECKHNKECDACWSRAEKEAIAK